MRERQSFGPWLKLTFSASFTLFTLTSCVDYSLGSPDENEVVYIAQNKAACARSPESQCYLARKSKLDPWQPIDLERNLSDREIRSFNYEIGYQYRLTLLSVQTVGAPVFARQLTWLNTLEQVPVSLPALVGQP
jgi:Domain of unknown function (DUF4377)